MDSIDDQGRPGHSVTAGARLRSAREAVGLSRSDIASRTKIAERHLLAIEEDRLGDLAARTYAVGFARAYARALGMDELEIAGIVRTQLEAESPERGEIGQSFEPGDPARVPPVRVAWLAGAGAVVVIALLLLFWSSYLSPEGELPDLLPSSTPVAAASPVVKPAAAPRPVAGPVVLLALSDGVWLQVTDASGARLLEKTMAKGESWTVPTGAQAPVLRTGRPDALQISVGGRSLALLADKPSTVSGVSLIAADLLARGQAMPAGTPSPAAAIPAPVAAPLPGPAPAAVTTPASRLPAPAATAGTAPRRPAPAPSATATTRPRPAAQPTGAAPAGPASAPAATPAPPPASEPVSTVSG